jgi:hypothetical protein
MPPTNQRASNGFAHKVPFDHKVRELTIKSVIGCAPHWACPLLSLLSLDLKYSTTPMSENIWIAVATIIASFIASFAAAGWQVRAMRQIANPAQPPPRYISRASHAVWLLIKRYWLLAVAIVAPIVGEFTALSSPDISTKDMSLQTFAYSVALAIPIATGITMRRVGIEVERANVTIQAFADQIIQLRKECNLPDANPDDFKFVQY